MENVKIISASEAQRLSKGEPTDEQIRQKIATAIIEAGENHAFSIAVYIPRELPDSLADELVQLGYDIVHEGSACLGSTKYETYIIKW